VGIRCGQRCLDARNGGRRRERDDGAAESAASHPRASSASGDRGLDRDIGLWPGHLEVVAQGRVGLGQHWADGSQVTTPEQVGHGQDALVLAEDVADPAAEFGGAESGQVIYAVRQVAQGVDAERRCGRFA
jgi:hypothetical protein